MVAAGVDATETLSPIDATLWAIRRDPELRTTIVALGLLDRTPDWPKLEQIVARAIERIPRLRQRVVEPPLGAGRPHWAEVEPDLRFHLRRVSAPGAGGLDGVLELCGALAAEDFDEARPLWEVVVVEGVEDDRAALILKVSHSLTDGVGGIALLSVLDDQADDPLVESAPPTASPRSFGQLFSLPASVVSAAVHAGLHPVHAVEDAASVVRSAGKLLSPAGPPLSPLMVDRSLGRWTGVTELSMGRLREAAHRAGGTINDAFVTIALGALADYHQDLGSDGRGFRVTMPVSFRSDGDADGGNQWTPARVVLEVDRDAHPFDELQLYRQILHRAAHEPAISFSHGISAGVQQLPAGLTTGIVAGMVKGSDVALTDVPGLDGGLTIAGARVTHLYPFAPTGGAALNIGLVSHDDTACIGFTIDTAAVSEPDRLVARFESRANRFVGAYRPQTPDRPATRSSPRETEEHDEHERLSSLDTSFLRMETHTTPMHMGLLTVLDGTALRDADGGLDLEAFGRHMARRVAQAPRLRQRVLEVPLELGRPVWIDDPDFSIDDHLHVSALASPGDRVQLMARCEEIQMQRLDRRRALFDMHLLTDLDEAEFGPGAVALVTKVHHALLDGMSGVELLSVLYDLEAEVSDADETEPEPVEALEPPSSMQLISEAVADAVREPLAWMGGAVSAARAPLRSAHRLAATAGALADLVTSRPPSTLSLNRTVGEGRRLLSITQPLARVHDTGAELGGTINDVVLSAVTIGLRSLFEHRDEPVEGPLKAMVPVSTRRVGMDDEHGNHVAALVVELPIDIDEPVATVVCLSGRIRELKQHHHADGTEVLLDAANHLPPVAVDLMSRLSGHQHLVNLVVTNLPGPPAPLYIKGAEVRELVPIVPLGSNLTLGVAVLSYGDDLVLAFHGDAEACPDLEVLTSATEAAFTTLAQRAGLS